MRKMTSALLIIVVFSLSTVLVSGQVTPNMFRKMNDFDGDGKTDFAVTRREGNSKVWYIWQSRDGFRAFYWGVYSDANATGDYDGDGKTDITVFRPTNAPPIIHYFWIWNSGSNNFTQVGFENGIAVAPMQQDYNGDGKTDPGVWFGSIVEPPGSQTTNVHVKYSGTPGALQFQVPPQSRPLRLGDMTGDGRADAVHYKFDFQINNNAVTITDILTGASRVVPFGLIEDNFVPGDFDGDGIGDLAIWRSSDGNWWWLKSSDNTVRAARWGVNGDIPVPGDYDGDGITDLAIWRPGSTQAYYWVYGSQNGISVLAWGISSDQPVQF